MLSTDEVLAITLKSKFVYDHGNKSYFTDGINKISEHLQKYIQTVLNTKKKNLSSSQTQKPQQQRNSVTNLTTTANDATTINTEHLNFFVRYKCREGEEEYHKWSQIEQVVLLSAVNAAAAAASQKNTQNENNNNNNSLTIDTSFADASTQNFMNNTQSENPTITTNNANNNNNNFMIWKNKLFWIALKLKFETKYVSLSRLSASTPTEDEVKQYCLQQQASDPLSGIFEDAPSSAVHNNNNEGEAAILSTQGILSEAPITVTTTEDNNNNHNAELRQYLPTKIQIELLKLYKQKFFAEHSWTQEEIEETRRLQELHADQLNEQQQKQQQQEENNQQQQQQHGRKRGREEATATATASGVSASSYVGAAAAPIQAALRHSEQMRTISAWGLLQAPPEGNKPQVTLLSSQQHANPLTNNNNNNSSSVVDVSSQQTISPFLPLKLRRQLLNPNNTNTNFTSNAQALNTFENNIENNNNNTLAPSDSVASSSAFDIYNNNNNNTLNGDSQATATPSQDLYQLHHQNLNENDTILTENFLDRVPQTTQEWSDAATKQEALFYHYIKDENRSGFLNKTAKMTAHNHLLNKKIRLMGMENEKRMNRVGNLLESGLLWISDDRKRSEMAKQYKDMIESGEGEKKKKPEEGKVAETKNAVAAAVVSAAAAVGGDKDEAPANNNNENTNEDNNHNKGQDNADHNNVYANLTAPEIQFLKTYKDKKSKQEILFADAISDDFVQQTENLIRSVSADMNSKNKNNNKDNKLVQSQLVFRSALRNVQRQ